MCSSTSQLIAEQAKGISPHDPQNHRTRLRAGGVSRLVESTGTRAGNNQSGHHQRASARRAGRVDSRRDSSPCARPTRTSPSRQPLMAKDGSGFRTCGLARTSCARRSRDSGRAPGRWT